MCVCVVLLPSKTSFYPRCSDHRAGLVPSGRYAALACNTDVASLLGGLVKSLVLHSFRLVTFPPPRSRGPHLPIRLSLKSLKFLLLRGKGRGREGEKKIHAS